MCFFFFKEKKQNQKVKNKGVRAGSGSRAVPGGSARRSHWRVLRARRQRRSLRGGSGGSWEGHCKVF